MKVICQGLSRYHYFGFLAFPNINLKARGLLVTEIAKWFLGE